MLGSLSGSVSGSALAINNQAQIVGYSSISSTKTTHAFLYENGVMNDLNSLLETNKSGWVLTDATAISNSGFIVGTGYLNGISHGYLLYPLDKKKRLNVNLSGVGAVSSVDADVNCLLACEYMLNDNMALTLNANAAAGFIFNGWSGDCVGIGLCQLKMDVNKEVTAKFISKSTPKFYINVTKSSLGMITSSPTSISCGLTKKLCKSYFYKGEKVALTASPNKGKYVKSWKGCSSSSGNSCSVSIAKNVTVTAQFATLKK
jgi:probable HAF family extracellular repeat protein